MAEFKLQQVEIWKIPTPGGCVYYLYRHDNGLWSIRDGFESSHVLTRRGTLEHEPGHSHRQTNFPVIFRFDSQEDALQALQNALETTRIES